MSPLYPSLTLHLGRLGQLFRPFRDLNSIIQHIFKPALPNPRIFTPYCSTMLNTDWYMPSRPGCPCLPEIKTVADVLQQLNSWPR